MNLAGSTSSSNFPLQAAVESLLNAGYHGFVSQANYISVTADSVAPESGSGLTQTFTLQYSDSGGAASLATVWAAFGTASSYPAPNSCGVYYSQSANTVYLENDAGTGTTRAVLGSTGTLQNTQCSVSMPGTTVASNGNSVILNLAVTFNSGFSGTKGISLWAGDAGGTNSGWQSRGTWTIPAPVVIVTADSATPGSGSGLTQTFTLQYSDSAGAAGIATVWAAFGSASSYPASISCGVYYSRSANTVYLENDAGTGTSSAVLGSTGTLQNSQCSVKMATTTVMLNGNSLILNLTVTFNSGFSGQKNISLWAGDAGGTNSGWQSRGTWTIPAPIVGASADSATPSSGSGLTQTFALQYSDSGGAASFTTLWVAFSATSNILVANSCALFYNPSLQTLYLENDSGIGWQAATVGGYRTIQNSQCTVNAASGTVSQNGNTLILNLPVTFGSGYSGTKSIYLRATDSAGNDTGWVSRGSWTIGTTTVNVTADSVAPSSGSGLTQTFALQYSDSGGAASLATVWAAFGSASSYPAPNTCGVYYSRSANTVYLENDAGAGTTSAVLGSTGTLQNSQCSVSMGSTTVALNGNSLILNLAVTFNSSFSGSKSIYLWAAEAGGINSGWQSRGTWTIPTPTVTVTADSVAPASGSGSTQTFTLQYSDSGRAASLGTVWAAFGSASSYPAPTSCGVYYSRSTNTVYLENDAGTGTTSAVLGSTGTLQNSQCSVSMGSTTVALNGNSLILNLALTFNSSFSGTKNVSLWAADAGGTNSGWQSRGTWTVPGAIQSGPMSESVTPSTGSGLTQTFTLQFSDSGGAASLQMVWQSFSASSNALAPNSCTLFYIPSANTVYLAYDSASGWTGAPVGGYRTLQNSQCTVNVAGATVAIIGSTLTLSVPVTFSAAFAGTANIYLRSEDSAGNDSGWVSRGSWTVGNATLSVTADSVAPSAGSGSTQTFALQYSDSGGASNLATVWAAFGSAASYPAPNTCGVYYSRSANTIYLENDSATAASGALLGSTATLQNSQCSVNMGGTTVALNGNSLLWNLAVTFHSSFAGAKSVYLWAADAGGTNSGWQSRGTWTIPAPGVSVTADSVAPASGSGSTQTFTLQYSDSGGAASLATVWAGFGSAASYPAPNTCGVYYNRSANTIYLENDAATAASGALLGSTATLQNSQCSVSMAGTSVTLNGNSLIFNFAVTFNSAFSGTKNISLWAGDAGGINSGWQSRGTWTVPGSGSGSSPATVSPSSGSGLTQTFSLQYFDKAGASSLQSVWVAFSATSNAMAPNSCALFYNPSSNMLYLENDSGVGWQAAAVGGYRTIQNSQCAANAGGGTISVNGNTLTLNLPMTFSSSYGGAKTIYLRLEDAAGTDTGWLSGGSWTGQ